MGQNSLQEWCLQVIVKHLDLFSYAFNATTDAQLRRNFEFLQRCYSNKMLALSTKDSIKEAHFPLLINEHVSEVHLDVLARFHWETITQKIAEIGEGLLKISFSTQRYEPSYGYHPAPETPPYANIFPHLKNITILCLEICCDDEALKNIAKYCPHLVELNIFSSRVTNEGVRKYLCQKNERNEAPHTKLRKLDIRCANVDGDVTELILMSFPDLEELEASGEIACTLHEMHQQDSFQNNFSNVKKFKLTKLNLVRCNHSHNAEFLKLYPLICPDVNSLAAKVILPDELNALANFKKLKELTLIYSTDYPRPNLNNYLISVGTRLTSLTLYQFSLSVEVLINNCPLLEVLHMTDISFQPSVKNSTKTFKFLKKFYLYETLMNDAATSKSISDIFSATHRLETMFFVQCRSPTDEMRDAFVYCCTRCPLKEVYFVDSNCDFSLLKSILLSSRTLKHLESISTSSANLNQNDFYLLTDIASNLANKPTFVCHLLR